MDREERQEQRQAQRASLLAGTPFGGGTTTTDASGKPKKPRQKKPKNKTKPRKPKGNPTPGLKQGVSDAYHREESGGSPEIGFGSWVDPNHSYGSGYGALLPMSQLKTGHGQKLAENDPRSLFNHHLALAGLPTRTNSLFGQYLQTEFYDDIMRGYGTAKQYNDLLTLDRYIRGLGGGSIGEGAGAPAAPAQGTTKGKQGKGKNARGKNGKKASPSKKTIQEAVPKNLPPKQRKKALERERDRRAKINANRAAARSKTGTKTVDPRYGDKSEHLDLLARRSYLALPPSLRGHNASLFGAGDTAWSAFR